MELTYSRLPLLLDSIAWYQRQPLTFLNRSFMTMIFPQSYCFFCQMVGHVSTTPSNVTHFCTFQFRMVHSDFVS